MQAAGKCLNWALSYDVMEACTTVACDLMLLHGHIHQQDCCNAGQTAIARLTSWSRRRNSLRGESGSESSRQSMAYELQCMARRILRSPTTRYTDIGLHPSEACSQTVCLPNIHLVQCLAVLHLLLGTRHVYSTCLLAQMMAWRL